MRYYIVKMKYYCKGVLRLVYFSLKCSLNKKIAFGYDKKVSLYNFFDTAPFTRFFYFERLEEEGNALISSIRYVCMY